MLLLPIQIAIKELKPVDIDAASDVDAYFRLKQVSPCSSVH